MLTETCRKLILMADATLKSVRNSVAAGARDPHSGLFVVMTAFKVVAGCGPATVHRLGSLFYYSYGRHGVSPQASEKLIVVYQHSQYDRFET